MADLTILRDLTVIFAVSVLVILLFHRLRLPALPGFIVAGALVGPNALGLVSDVHAVESLAEVGVVLLLFTIGIELSLDELRSMSGKALSAGVLQMALVAAGTAAVALAFVSRWQVALFLGFLVSLSSTAIVLKTLTDQGTIDAPHGRLAAAILILQDLGVVPMMLAIPVLAGTAPGGGLGLLLALGKAALVVAGVLFAARTVVPRALPYVLKTRSRELFLIAVILLSTLTALATAAVGVSLALGAFLAGLVLSESDYGHQALAELLPFRDVFLSLFFVTVGMLVQLDFVRAHPLLTLGGAVVIMGGKAILNAQGPAILGMPTRVVLLAALAVAQIGEFAFVLAREGREAGLLSEFLYQLFLATAVPTMLFTPLLLQAAPKLAEVTETTLRRLRVVREPSQSFAPAAEPIADHVVIAGFGLNGRNLATALKRLNVPHLVVELNAQVVREARARGEPAFYGDATRAEILKNLAIDRARLFVVAISDPAATRRMVRLARQLNPRLHIIVRTRYVAEIQELSTLGADIVIPEEFETSLEIFSRVLAHYGVGREEIDVLTQEVRDSHYAALRGRSTARPSLTGVFSRLPQMTVERIRVTPEAWAAGRTLAATRLRSVTGTLVLSIQRGNEDLPTPDPREPVQVGDVLLVVGQPSQLAEARRLLVDGPGASSPAT